MELTQSENVTLKRLIVAKDALLVQRSHTLENIKASAQLYAMLLFFYKLVIVNRDGHVLKVVHLGITLYMIIQVYSKLSVHLHIIKHRDGHVLKVVHLG